MALKDSGGGDYLCFYDEVVVNQKIRHTATDKRKTTVLFFVTENRIRLTGAFL